MLIELARADLLTTFVITQHMGAIKRILAADRRTDDTVMGSRVQQLIDGKQFGSVGISHLTTSRRHLERPVVRAEVVGGGYRIEGTIPWVTGAPHVDQIVVGATLPNGDEILALIDTQHAGLRLGRGAKMLAMAASCTDAVELDGVRVDDALVLSGPRPKVLSAKSTDLKSPAGAGGLQTSALAAGLSSAALDYLRVQSNEREHLVRVVRQFDQECDSLRKQIISAAAGESDEDFGGIRMAANALVQRITAAAMTTAKGAGLMADHPVGRWCCQALFFLVWSCPQPVAQAHLCEMAGLELTSSPSG